MKRVIYSGGLSEAEISPEPKPITEPLTKCFFGVESPGDCKGFIHRTEYEKGPYKAFCVDSFTIGNGWPMVKEGYLDELILELLDLGFEVFKFETPQELFAWLSK
jgi:hypothetical protein